MNFFCINLTALSRLKLYAIILFIAMPGVAHANAGLPMIFVTLPGMVAALAPVIAIETFLMARLLGVRRAYILGVVTLANAVSTILGVPMAWLALTVVQMITGGGSAHGLDTVFQRVLAVTWQAPWLIPYEEAAHWMVPAASLFLLIPFFFASWWLEYRVARKWLPNIEPDVLRRALKWANVMSYSVLAVLVLGWLIVALRSPST